MYLPSAGCRSSGNPSQLEHLTNLPAIDPVLRAVRERRRREFAERHIRRCGCLYFCDVTDGEEFQYLKKIYWSAEPE
jgi:hypothetical protein